MVRPENALQDAVERQVAAYNAHDVDGFVACYAKDVVVLDADGNETMRGRDGMAAMYGAWFTQHPELRAEIVQRLRVGAFVVDEELVTGLPGGDFRAIAIYRVGSDGLIDRVQFLE